MTLPIKPTTVAYYLLRIIPIVRSIIISLFKYVQIIYNARYHAHYHTHHTHHTQAILTVIHFLSSTCWTSGVSSSAARANRARACLGQENAWLGVRNGRGNPQISGMSTIIQAGISGHHCVKRCVHETSWVWGLSNGIAVWMVYPPKSTATLQTSNQTPSLCPQWDWRSHFPTRLSGFCKAPLALIGTCSNGLSAWWSGFKHPKRDLKTTRKSSILLQLDFD